MTYTSWMLLFPFFCLYFPLISLFLLFCFIPSFFKAETQWIMEIKSSSLLWRLSWTYYANFTVWLSHTQWESKQSHVSVSSVSAEEMIKSLMHYFRVLTGKNIQLFDFWFLRPAWIKFSLVSLFFVLWMTAGIVPLITLILVDYKKAIICLWRNDDLAESLPSSWLFCSSAADKSWHWNIHPL